MENVGERHWHTLILYDAGFLKKGWQREFCWIKSCTNLERAWKITCVMVACICALITILIATDDRRCVELIWGKMIQYCHWHFTDNVFCHIIAFRPPIVAKKKVKPNIYNFKTWNKNTLRKMSLFYLIYTEERNVGEEESLKKRQQAHMYHEKAEF